MTIDTDRQERIRRYAAGAGLLRATFERVPEEARQWRPAVGKWSAHEVVCHCADSEAYAAIRIRFLLAQDNPIILGYDEALWARVLDYHALSTALALDTVDAVRANTLPLLRRLEDDDFLRAGQHTESGAFSVDRWLEVYADHLEIHSRQMERNLAAWSTLATNR